MDLNLHGSSSTTIDPESSVEKVTLRSVTRRLIPFLFVLYVVAFLDRVNVGFAALEMNRDLGLSAAVYGFGAGIFFIGYSIFEVPSNLILARTGARLWIGRIMITWGLIAAAMMFVRGPISTLVVIFLSLASAGLLSSHGPFWPLPSRFLSGAAAAGGIALINSLANLSGFAGPYAVGLLNSASGDFRSGFLLLAFVPLTGMALALRLRHTAVLRRGR